jgi:hypothetical protein
MAIATGAMTMVCVDTGPPMRAVPVPAGLRERVEVASTGPLSQQADGG